MSRKPRKYQINRSLIFHVINRGILKQEIFHDEQDFRLFIEIVYQYIKKEGVKVYHWCLMNNHYHIVLEITDTHKLSKLVGGWQQVYAVKYHKRYNTAGKLFQNRFKSQAIEKETYLLYCGRYVERNPVRAGICKTPWNWPWSSAGFYVYNKKDPLTTADPLWTILEKESYRSFLSEKSENDKLFKGSLPIVGSKDFSNKFLVNDNRVIVRGRGRKPNIN